MNDLREQLVAPKLKAKAEIALLALSVVIAVGNWFVGSMWLNGLILVCGFLALAHQRVRLRHVRSEYATRVVSVRTDVLFIPRQHEHVIMLQLGDGRKLAVGEAIEQLNQGADLHMIHDGQRQEVAAVECPTCHCWPYLIALPAESRHA